MRSVRQLPNGCLFLLLFLRVSSAKWIRNADLPTMTNSSNASKLTTATWMDPVADRRTDGGLLDVLTNKDSRSIIVHSLFVLAGLTIVVAGFFCVKIALLRLKQRRTRRYSNGNRVELQRLEEDQETEIDESEIFAESNQQQERMNKGQMLQNGRFSD